MIDRNSSIVRVGFLACWLLIFGEWITDIYFGHLFPGYNWHQQSISYLGQVGSPVEQAVKYWGVVFSILLVFFARGYWEAFRPGVLPAVVAFLIAIYGLGEGIGSGQFPINPPDMALTTAAKWHNILGGIGDTAIVILPLVLFREFRHRTKLSRYFILVIILGLAMAGLFLVAKWWAPTNLISQFKGLWQRIYVSNYHLMLGVLSFQMMKRSNKIESDGQT